MGADFSRVRLNPLLDYAGVELKQGAVLLDADANELVAILDRRLRALASDTLGRATVSSTTPEAFKITATAGALQIGRGRLYVDGLLAENHGAASDQAAQRAFDDLMAEPVFTQTVPYAAQPYLPNPPALPTAGVHLVYLDVWDRELTHLQSPALVESAVGVETSSRRQTVWQVRVLAEAAGNAGCASPDGDVPGWSALIAPSTGVLSTGTFEVAAVSDPCELPPTGGYRGLENQLYRVQIHDAGQPGGGATFKWSRENASVGSRVASMVSATQLELETLGRDEVLGLHSGDWVEIVDEARELAQAPGEMRRITVDTATRRITFAPALPAAMLPGNFPNSDFPKARGLRVQRWDQKGRVFRTGPNGTTVQVQDLDAASSTGLIAVPAAAVTLLLENGVTVRFDSTGAKGFRSGDHWEFAARTADASVELLDRAPPRGIHHHYARLGFWDVAAGTVSDCRHPWPPAGGGTDCSCTACVTPESHASGQLTIQGAIDKVRDTGGTVCLHAGQYALAEPVRITGARSVRVHGQGPATVITAAGSAFIIERSAAIAIEEMAVVSLGRASAISVRSVTGLALRALVLAVLNTTGDTRGAGIALAGIAAGVAISDNLVIAPDGIRALEPGDEGAPRFLISALLRINGNVLWCQRTGLMLSGAVAHLYDTRIADNQLLGCRTQGIGLLGLALPGAAVRIAGNSLAVNGPGIRCAVDGAWIEANKLTALRQGERQPTGAGISLTVGLDPSGSDQCQVLGNQVDGFPDAGVLVQAPAMSLLIAHNLIERCGNGILMIDAARSGSLAVTGNQLRELGSERTGEAVAQAVTGIGITRTEAATISGNMVRRVGVNAAQGKQLIAGILAQSVQRVRIGDNEVMEIGPAGEFGGLVAGLMVRSPYAQAAITHNHVERDAQASEQPSPTAWHALLIDEPDARERVLSRAAGFTAVRLDTARTLVLAGNRAWVDAGITAVDAAGAAVVRGASASVLGNTLIARGRLPAVDASAGGELMFCDNRCELRANQNIDAVRLAAPVAVVNANRVRGGKPSITVAPQNAVLAAIGNITTSSIAGPIKPEMAPLNLIG